MKIIFTDFMGVLDEVDSYKHNSFDYSTLVTKQVDENLAYKLFKFCIEHDLYLIPISSVVDYGCNLLHSMKRKMKHSSQQEISDFAKSAQFKLFMEKQYDLDYFMPSGDKSNKIKTFFAENDFNVEKYVIIDDEIIKDVKNQIKINGRLQDHHFDKMKNILEI